MSELIQQPNQSVMVTAFELAQREAKALASSNLIPDAYKNNVPNCLIAINMSNRIGIDPLTVIQNLHVINGKPGWSSSFMIGAFNSRNERFGQLNYEELGEVGKDSWGYRAWAVEKETKEKVYGPKITIGIAKAEGWTDKKMSKWRTIPELMLMYRAAAFFIRLYAPDLVMGVNYTDDEVRDMSQRSRVNINSYESKQSKELPKHTLQALETETTITEAEIIETTESEVVEDEIEQGELPLDCE